MGATVKDVYACFELDGYDAPILRAIKTYDRALKWIDKDMDNRFLMFFAVDTEPVTIPPRDLFEMAQQTNK